MLDALEILAKQSDAVAPASCFDLTRDLFEKPENLGASKEGDRSTNQFHRHGRLTIPLTAPA